MNVSKIIKFAVLTLVVFFTFAPLGGVLHNLNFFWLGAFPLLGLFFGKVGHIIFAIMSYICIPETPFGLCIVVTLSVFLLIGGQLLADYSHWLNFRIVSLIYSAVIIVDAIIQKDLEGDVTFFNVFVTILIFVGLNLFLSYKENKDFKEYLENEQQKSIPVQIVEPRNFNAMTNSNQATNFRNPRIMDILNNNQKNESENNSASINTNTTATKTNDTKVAPKETPKEPKINPKDGNFKEPPLLKWIQKQ